MKLARWLACLLILIAVGAKADDGVPGLLKFAEQYQQREAAAREKAAASQKGNDGDLSSSSSLLLRQSLKERDRLLARQRAELVALQQEIQSLKNPPLPDFRLLKRWLTAMRQVWQGTPEEVAERLRQAQQQAEQSREAQAAADAALAQVKREKESLGSQYAKDREGWKQQETERRQQFDTQQQELRQRFEAQQQELRQRFEAQQKELQQAQGELAGLRRREWNITPEQLKEESARLSYAAGSALGMDIRTMVEERQSWGMAVEQPLLLAGGLDVLTGYPQLPPEELSALVAKADEAASAAREQALATRSQQDRDYLAAFSKQAGVKKSPLGFLYRVNYAGDEALPENAVVDLVVKEMLTDGSVIQDMEVNGKVLSQPLASYPPLFREAIGYLRNHGSVTLVVPPELAYGKAGYPPKILPDTTMVYEVRISDVRRDDTAAADKKE